MSFACGFHVFLAILLSTGAAASAAPAKLHQRTALECEVDAFAQGLTESPEYDGSVRHFEDAPLNHLGTYLAEVEQSRIHNPKIEVPADFKFSNQDWFVLPGESVYVQVVERSPNRLEARIEAPWGSRYFKIKRRQGSSWMIEVKRDSIGWIKQKPYLPAVPKLTKGSWNLTAESLARNQANASESVTGSDHQESLLKDLIKANVIALEVLQSGKPLTLENIEAINRSISVSELTEADSIALAGVTRGTKPRIVELADGRKIRVDMQAAQMLNQSPPYWYLPASDVPGQMKNWLRRVNDLNSKTSLRTILELYQQFIVIHPFGASNGRTSRVLLDFMLQKARFPIPTHSVQLTREVVYRSLEELENEFMRAYRP